MSTLAADVADYCFRDDSMFVVPIEHLGPRGMTVSFRQELASRERVAAGWSDNFDAAFALYQERAAALAARLPGEWMPPRLQHCCVITQPTRVRPFFQPFNQSAWLFYADDFAPATSSRERATYLFFHMERMGLLRDVSQTLVRNLSYFLTLSDEQSNDFADGCRRSTRPDAAGFVALAEALPWIRGLTHPVLNPSRLVAMTPALALANTTLTLPQAWRPRFDVLMQAWAAAAQSAVEQFHQTYARRGKERGGELCRWISEKQPRLLLTDKSGIVWDFERPEDTVALRKALGGVGQETADSLRRDWQAIDRLSRAFLACLAPGTRLPEVHSDPGQNGLSYMHRERQVIAYNLREAGMERLKVPAPPYERLMLGARTIHEWGHLAADAGWIHVAPQRRDIYDTQTRELCDLLDRCAQDLPSKLGAMVSPELINLRGKHGSVGRGLARVALDRMSDFQSNLLARAFLSADETDTYVRNNVVSRFGASRPSAVLQRLVRSAFEYQYLRFSRIADPLAYFLDSTWFREEYLHSGVIRGVDLAPLLSLVGALCDAQEIDPQILRFPAVPAPRHIATT